jgi:N-acetylmuramoyl-L-alanine amidase
MRNAAEAARMTSAEGRQQYASAIAAAVEAYLG